MPAAICIVCAAVTHWRNQRGSRLAAVRCHKCGSPGLEPAACEDGKYIPRFASRGNAGRKIRVCSLCGRRSFKIRSLPVRARFRYGYDIRLVDAGGAVCWFHWDKVIGECSESEYYPCDDPALGHEIRT